MFLAYRRMHSKVKEALLTEKVVQGQKNHNLDGEINALLKI